MNTEIYIEGVHADLTQDVSALFTYAIDDVTNISSRDTGFSRTIVFPGTVHNNHLFGSAFEFTGFNDFDPTQPNIEGNFNAAKAAECRILVHGIQIFKGVLRLMEIQINGGHVLYEAQVVGELGGLMAAIGNRLLTGNTDTEGGLSSADDLDFSNYNQAWTHANIIQSWADLAATGYLGFGLYYPLIDYGLTTLNRIDFSYQAMRPALYVHEYLVKIFDKAGYTFESTFLETAFFLRLIVPHNEDVVYKFTRGLVDNKSSIVTLFLEDTPTTIGVTSRVVNYANESFVPVNFTTAYSTSPSGAVFTYTGGAAAVRMTATLFMEYGGGNGNVLITTSINVNGTAVPGAVQTFYLTHNHLGGTHPATVVPVDVTIDVPYFTLTPGDIVTVSATASYPVAPPSGAWRIDLLNSSRFTITSFTEQATPAVYGDDLYINNLIPKGVLQKDFLLSIIKMFNLRIIEDPQKDKHVIITPYVDFFDNSDPLDWTMKMDRSREITLTPMSELNARYYNFLYEKDTDYDNETYFKRYSRGYADRTVDVGLDFVKEKKDLKIIFAPSPLIGVSGLDKAVTRIMKVENGTEERTGSKIRILQAKRIAVSNWDFLQDDLSTVINNSSYYGYAGHVDDPGTPSGADLNFGAPAEIYWVPANPYLPTTIYAQFYSPYIAEIADKDSKLLTAYFRLSPMDILNLDFGKSIFIDGQLWRLARVMDYNGVREDVTKVQALKVINLSY